MSSKKTGGSDNWGTPRSFIDYLQLENDVRFDLDAAASKSNRICKNFISEEQNALVTPWEGDRVWCNPPYSLSYAFFERGLEQIENFNSAYFLIPARPDTALWHELILDNPRCWVMFIQGRLKFIGAEHPAPFPSAIVGVSRYSPCFRIYKCSPTPKERGF